MERIAATKKSGSPLRSDVERHLIKEAEDGWDPTNRRQDVIHPSEIAAKDWCPRSTYLRIKSHRAGTLKPRAPHAFQLQNIFDEGHAYHDKWQSRFQRMDRLYGTWRCTFCRERWEAVSPDECPRCGAPEDGLRYAEVGLHDNVANIHGHADGKVTALPHVRAPGDPLIEVKSVGEGTVRQDNPSLLMEHTYEVTTKRGTTRKILDHKGMWDSISTVFPSHARQGYIYLRLDDEATEIIFIYEYKPTSAVKTFVMKRNDAAVDHLWDTCLDIMFALDHDGPIPLCPNTSGQCDHCKIYLENDDDRSPTPPRRRTERGTSEGERPRVRIARAARTPRPAPAADRGAAGDAGRPVRPRGPRADLPHERTDVVGRLRGWPAGGR